MPKNTKPSPTFCAEDFEALCFNEYRRYTPASDKIGHVVIHEKDNQQTVQQFKPPNTENNKHQWHELKNIELFEQGGTIQGKAQLQDGTEMIGRRSMHIVKTQDGGNEYSTVLLFSPKMQGQMERPFADVTQVLEKEKTSKTKNQQTNISPRSVVSRGITKRKPTQRKVMHGSALQYMQKFYAQNQRILSTEEKSYMQQRLINHSPPLSEAKHNYYYPEWMHAVAYSLSPMHTNPQCKENISAGPQWANTAMMPIERTLKYFALKQSDTQQSVATQFEHVGESELLAKANIQGNLANEKNALTINQEINIWAKNPTFARATDVAQTAWISYALLHDLPPEKSESLTKTGCKSST